jgi:hypothetical protein
MLYSQVNDEDMQDGPGRQEAIPFGYKNGEAYPAVLFSASEMFGVDSGSLEDSLIEYQYDEAREVGFTQGYATPHLGSKQRCPMPTLAR